MFRTAIITAAAVAATALTGAATAAERAPSDRSATLSVQRSADGSTRYCLNRSPTGDSAVTGSILSHRDCRTREQWEAKGVSLPKD